MSAFAHLALDSGARKSELAGLQWTDLDLDSGTLTIARQLDTSGSKPTYGPTKTGKPRTLSLGAETIARLRTHRKRQRELMMANRKVYADHGLVFAKEPEHLQVPTATLGEPITTLSGAHFRHLVKPLR